MMNAKNRREAETQIEQTAESWSGITPKAANCLRDDAERMLAYYEFPGSALAAFAYDEHHRIKLRRRSYAHQRLQEITQRNIRDICLCMRC